MGLPKSNGGLGFKNLGDFNTALLAKQAWRLHLEPDAFWARVIKDIYYPYSSILHVGKGSRASWAWSSILEGKALIVECSRWKVDNGNSINIWEDRWLLNSEPGFIRHVLPIPQTCPSKVSHLINWEEYTWNLDPISSLIFEPDRKSIKMLMLSDEMV